MERAFHVRIAHLVSLLWMVAATSTAAAQINAKDDAQRAYLAGQYSEAAKVYEALLEEKADDPALHFNLGTARYKQDAWERALREFEQSVATEEASARAQAYYNLGNSLFRLGRAEEALRSYKVSMELDSYDEDSKFNYEYVRRLLAQSTQPEPDDTQQEKEPREAQPDEEDQEGKGDEQEQSPEQNEAEQPEQGEQPREERTTEDLSREEAERILDALRGSESEMMKERLRQRTRGRKLDKDW